MSISKAGKTVVVSSIKQDFAQSAASFLVGVRGLSVEQMRSLRGRLREKDGKLQVAKVRLMKRALNDVQDADQLMPILKEQIALVFVREEAPAVAKLLCEFSKEHEKLSIVAGYMDSMVIDASSVAMIASLPSKDVLRAKLLGTLQAPITGSVVVLNQMLARMVYVLKRIEEQK